MNIQLLHNLMYFLPNSWKIRMKLLCDLPVLTASSYEKRNQSLSLGQTIVKVIAQSEFRHLCNAFSRMI